VKSLSEYSLYALTTFGFSLLQGPHQLAQKSIRTILPFNSESFNISPFGFSYESSGALSPMFNPVFCAIPVQLINIAIVLVSIILFICSIVCRESRSSRGGLPGVCSDCLIACALDRSVSNEDKLELYSLFKQANVGDCNIRT